MAETKVGNAYLEVEDKVSSSFGKSTTAAAAPLGKKFGGAFSVAAGNIMAQAFNEVVRVATDIFVEGFQGFADFEQLAGGVEKIFDQADQSKIFADAANAYKDLNLSANQYLESINQVGAAFSATMGDQRGYDVARQGMMAISDYASGTGRNLDELNQKYALITRSTASYQSIADQFSGILPATSKDFLEQAQAAGILSEEYTKLTEVPIAEYQDAVTQMLTKGVDELGLAGNTAKETASTISGSLAGLQASWSNFLAALFDKDADITPYLDALGESIEAAFTNVGAVVSVAITRIWELLIKFLNDAAASIGEVIANALLDIANSAGAIFSEMGEHLGEIWNNLNSLLTQAFNDMAQSASDIWNGIATSLGQIWGNLVNMVTGAFDSIKSTVTGVFSSIAQFASDTWGNILNTAQTIWNAIKTAIETPINAAKEIVHNAIEAIKGFFSFQFEWPHIPLPHFSISGSVNPIDWLTQGLPQIGIDWYAEGGFVNGATLIGAGERGAEMILPQDGALMDSFANKIADRFDDRLIDWLDRNLGRTIADYTPTMTRREFDRMARGAVA